MIGPHVAVHVDSATPNNQICCAVALGCVFVGNIAVGWDSQHRGPVSGTVRVAFILTVINLDEKNCEVLVLTDLETTFLFVFTVLPTAHSAHPPTPSRLSSGETQLGCGVTGLELWQRLP